MQDSYDQDPITKRGIIILCVCLLLLVGFFFWYSKRSTEYQAPTAEGEKEGLLARIFSPSPQSEVAGSAVAADQDADGLSDSAEKSAGTDLAKTDSDGDGLSDREEANVYKTKPLMSDSDGDGMADGAEISARRDPLNPDPAAVWPPRPASLNL